MTLVPIEKTTLSASLKERAADQNWVAVNTRTGIHLVKTGANSYLLRVPDEVSQNFLENHEAIFSTREYTDYTILGATGRAEAVEIAHFLLQASTPIGENEGGQIEKEPAATALAL